MGIGMLLAGMMVGGVHTFFKQQAEGKAIRLWAYLTGLIPPFYRQRLARLPLQQLSLARLEPLLLDRIFSLTTLLNSVFLKSLRREAYAKVYGNEAYRGRTISTMIRCLTEEDFKKRIRRYQALP